VSIKGIVQVLHDRGLEVHVATHHPVHDALNRCGDFPQNPEFLAPIVEAGALQVCHTQFQLSNEFVVD